MWGHLLLFIVSVHWSPGGLLTFLPSGILYLFFPFDCCCPRVFYSCGALMVLCYFQSVVILSVVVAIDVFLFWPLYSFVLHLIHLFIPSIVDRTFGNFIQYLDILHCLMFCSFLVCYRWHYCRWQTIIQYIVLWPLYPLLVMWCGIVILLTLCAACCSNCRRRRGCSGDRLHHRRAAYRLCALPLFALTRRGKHVLRVARWALPARYAPSTTCPIAYHLPLRAVYLRTWRARGQPCRGWQACSACLPPLRGRRGVYLRESSVYAPSERS